MLTQPIRDKKQATALAIYFKDKGQYRNFTLVIMGIYTALRISDLLSLKWNDVYDFQNNRVRDVLHLSEKKTGKSTSIALNKEVFTTLNQFFMHIHAVPHEAIFKSQKTGKAIGRTQAYRIIRNASDVLSFQHRVSCHSLRKTLGYHAWNNGVSPAVIMDIYNHSSLAVTKRYLGVTQDDKDKVYLELNMTNC
ncbi:MAG: tyrosine-type recombinase/integrase [Oscillospiraceae bacterium]|nr:tyrosine-type recombinase/integrase [Oscillospiraceae bacterium]